MSESEKKWFALKSSEGTLHLEQTKWKTMGGMMISLLNFHDSKSIWRGGNLSRDGHRHNAEILAELFGNL